MEAANALDGLLGKQERHATFHDGRLVSVSVDYGRSEAVLTWALCVGDPDDSMRAARERRRTGRLMLSGVLFWVVDPPMTLDARPGLPWLTANGLLSEAPTETAKQLARVLPAGAVGLYFFFADWNASMYCGSRRLAYEWTGTGNWRRT